MSLVDKDTNLTFIKRLGLGAVGYVDLVEDDEGRSYARKIIEVGSEERAIKIINETIPLRYLSKLGNCHPLIMKSSHL